MRSETNDALPGPATGFSRRRFCRATAGAAAALAIARPAHASGGRARKKRARVAVIGADAMDPALLREFVGRGLMPHCARLLREGRFRKLRTTVPPQSPVVWSTFISGLDPGGHGIYDFITRDPATLAFELSTAVTSAPGHFLRVGGVRIPLSGGRLESRRLGPTLWRVLGEAGVPAVALKAPVNYPPTPTRARTLSGLATPDLHGSYGIFSLFTSDPGAESRDVPGGQIERVRLARHLAHCTLRGPENLFNPDRRAAEIEFSVERDPEHPLARVRIGSHDILLREGEWSGWLDVKFALLGPVVEVQAACRFYLKRVRPHLELYVSPLNIDPAKPALPISTPAGYSRELVAQVGRFYTEGMAEETAALSAGVFSDAEYRVQALHVLEEDLRLFRSQLARFRDGFFFVYFSSLDLNSHCFWRARDRAHPLYTAELEREHGDFLPSLYARIDGFVGEVIEHVGSEGQVHVISDHGFTSFRRQFNLNSWLLDHGFSSLRDPASRSPAPGFENTDWGRTRAYGLGINSLYLNLEGRERDGIVPPGADAERLRTELIAGLEAVRDPKDGRRVIRRVVRPESVFRTTAGDRVPDLIVCYDDNYRASWDTILGGYPVEHVLDNRDPWSGDHCMDPDLLPGVLLTTADLRVEDPAMEDMTPSILRAFGVPVPGAMKGRLLFG